MNLRLDTESSSQLFISSFELEFNTKAMLKACLLTEGIRLHRSFAGLLPRKPFYSVVTEGIELEVNGAFFVNAPIRENSPNELIVTNGQAIIRTENADYPVRCLPISQVLLEANATSNRPISDYCSISTDRANIWPVDGCYFAACNKPCCFCDVGFGPDSYQTLDQSLSINALKAVIHDTTLPIRHIQVTGGTPAPYHWDHFVEVTKQALSTGLPVSVMTSPTTPVSVLNELYESGVDELCVNIEFVSEELRSKLCPGKTSVTWDMLETLASKWPRGKVRSAIIIGPEKISAILQGIRRMAVIGIVPVLSPFRAVKGTPMSDFSGFTHESLYSLYMDTLEIMDIEGLFVGPLCSMCKHNVMAI